MSPSESDMRTTESPRDALSRRVDAGELSLVEALQQMRAILGLSQSAYARLVKVAPQTILDFESGRGNPTLETLRKIFKPFGFELTVRRRGRLPADAMTRELGEVLRAELIEAAEVFGESPSDVLSAAVRTYLALPGRVHERSWRLGVAEGLKIASDWIEGRREHLRQQTDVSGVMAESVDAMSELTRARETLAKNSARERELAEERDWRSLPRPWPRDIEGVVNVEWAIEIDGVETPPIHVSGEPVVGELAYDRGRYYVITDRRVHPRRVLALSRIDDTEGMRRLRKTRPERFRPLTIRSAE